MSFSILKLVVGPNPPVIKPNESHAKRPRIPMVKIALVPLQIRSKEEEKQADKTFTRVSRRDIALCLTAASVSGFTLFSPEHAEARISRAEMKRIIMEKLEMLRAKAGLTNSKVETGEKIPPPQPLEKGKKSSPPLPSLLNGAAAPLVEPTLP
ncbi:unnamed protein product [Ilex paraguariensis]|uniref:Uncharacterized protein n=1 Tax=Ilex paraguariensis TaxID=185542 RepID=A0ABC8SC46_9AQUA